MTKLIQIGHSKGIRIPKTLIQQADLEGVSLDLHLTSEGLLIKPITPIREGWREAYEAALKQGTIDYDQEWLDADLDEGFNVV